MSLNKPLAAVLVALVAFGGVAAAGTGAVGPQLATDDDTSTTNVNAQATYENGTVTVTVTDAGEPLQNATVFVDDEAVGTTDSNGTVTLDVNATDELEIELVGDDFEGELEYVIQDGELLLTEEEYEYDRDAADEDDAEDEESEDDAEEDAADEDDETGDADDADEADPDEDDAEDEESEDDADDAASACRSGRDPAVTGSRASTRGVAAVVVLAGERVLSV